VTAAKSGDLIAIFADESCIGNGREGANPGGAGGLVEWLKPGDSEVTRFEYWISEPATTNNRMALRSVIEAFDGISKRGNSFRVVFTSDSKYIVEGMSSWVSGWMARGWRRKAGAIENLELWQEAVEAVKPHETQWKWVRGHNGQPQNEYANHLATRAAADQTESGGLRASQYNEWVELQKSTKLRLNEAEPFPDTNSFKATPRAWTI
jgi:ribonuclease HI